MRDKKYHWYVIYTLRSIPTGQAHQCTYQGFRNKNLTVNDIQGIELSKELGTIKENNCCICSVSYLGYMTKKYFENE